MRGRAKLRCNRSLSDVERADAQARGWKTIGKLYTDVAIDVLSVETLLGLTS
jgi:hypothetical protein